MDEMEQEGIRAFELEKIRLENEAKAEAARAETEAARAETEAAKETERIRLQTEAARAETEANKLKLEAKIVKARMEHEYRMKEIEIRNRDMGAGGDAETNPNIITHLDQQE